MGSGQETKLYRAVFKDEQNFTVPIKVDTTNLTPEQIEKVKDLYVLVRNGVSSILQKPAKLVDIENDRDKILVGEHSLEAWKMAINHNISLLRYSPFIDLVPEFIEIAKHIWNTKSATDGYRNFILETLGDNLATQLINNGELKSISYFGNIKYPPAIKTKILKEYTFCSDVNTSLWKSFILSARAEHQIELLLLLLQKIYMCCAGNAPFMRMQDFIEDLHKQIGAPLFTNAQKTDIFMYYFYSENLTRKERFTPKACIANAKKYCSKEFLTTVLDKLLTDVEIELEDIPAEDITPELREKYGGSEKSEETQLLENIYELLKAHVTKNK